LIERDTLFRHGTRTQFQTRDKIIMRFKNYAIGDTRIKSGYLFFPKRINRSTRWLEYATWVEELNHGLFHNDWWNIRWFDDE
jgi:hypothetical protein